MSTSTIYRNAPYRDIGGPNGHVARHESFEGNSMSAHTDRDGTYKVLSYATVIATLSPDGLAWISDNHWGPTTGRHINICRAWLV